MCDNVPRYRGTYYVGTLKRAHFCWARTATGFGATKMISLCTHSHRLRRAQTLPFGVHKPWAWARTRISFCARTATGFGVHKTFPFGAHKPRACARTWFHCSPTATSFGVIKQGHSVRTSHGLGHTHGFSLCTHSHRLRRAQSFPFGVRKPRA